MESFCVKKIFFLRANFCFIKKNLENIVEFLRKSPKIVTYSLTNNISHDHMCYSMCNVNMLIIVTTGIIVHDVLVFYGPRSHRKLINLFWIATRRPLRGEVYNLSLKTRQTDLAMCADNLRTEPRTVCTNDQQPNHWTIEASEYENRTRATFRPDFMSAARRMI